MKEVKNKLRALRQIITNKLRQVPRRFVLGVVALSVAGLMIGMSLTPAYHFIRNIQIRAAATITWTGGGDGISWSDGANWNTGSAPSATDDVLIDTADTVNISSPTTINSLILGKTDGSAATGLNFTYDAVTLGALTLDTGDLTVYNGASITHPASTTDSPQAKIHIDVQSGDASILGSIDLTEKGFIYDKGPGKGVKTSGGAGGGAYGGNGGDGRVGAGGDAYGDLAAPSRLGSGGGDNGHGHAGYGGGVVKLVVGGTTTVNGSIISNGGYAYDDGRDVAGGGSGGSIWIDTTTLEGIGTIRADGGATSDDNYDAGGGSGGRIALYFDTDNSSFSRLSAAGGSPNGNDGAPQQGGAGTIYKKEGANDPDVIIDNISGYSSDRSRVALSILPDTFTARSLTVDNYANFVYGSTLTVNNQTLIDNNSFFYLTDTLSTSTLSIQNSANYYSQSGSSTTYSTLNWGANIIDNGGTFAAVSGGGDLTVPSGATFTANTARAFSNLTVNGSLTHSPNISTATYRIDFDITNDFTLGANGTVDLDSKGFDGGYGPGAGAITGYGSGGGAHGGNGGDGQSSIGGDAYGSFTEPITLGSGGGNTDVYAGEGGGALQLTVGGTSTIDGTISANGRKGSDDNFDARGGGAGGSIWIDSSTFAGTGTIRANGGGSTNDNYDGGGGAGGRIALYYDTDNSSLSTLVAAGARPDSGNLEQGGAGTIYKKEGANDPDVIVDNGSTGHNTVPEYVADTTLPSNLSLRSLTVDRYAELVESSDLTVSGTTLVDNTAILTMNGTLDTGTLSIQNSGNYYNQSSSTTTYSTLNWSGNIYDNGGTFALLSGGGDLTIPTNSSLYANTVRSFGNTTVNGNLTHSANEDTAAHKVDFTITGDFTLSSGGTINIDEKGYDGGYGPGAGVSTGYGSGGGAHGGNGGDGQSAAGGTAYGSLTEPTSLGSAGGNNDYLAGEGGGAIKLIVSGTTTIDGNLTANGGFGSDDSYDVRGGGAGGSIWIDTSTLAGSGIIKANGGATSNDTYDAGSGAGGRIALYYDTDTSSFNTLEATSPIPGGTGNTQGGAGTIYKQEGSNNGDVIIANAASSRDQSQMEKTPLNTSNTTLRTLTLDDNAHVSHDYNLTVTDTFTLQNNAEFEGANVDASTAALQLYSGAEFYNAASTTTTYASLDWNGGTLVDRGGTFALISNEGDLTIPASSTLNADTARTFNSITVNGILSHSENTDTEAYKIEYTSNSNFTVSGGGTLDITAKGFSGGNGPGAGTNGSHGAGGAGYGGAGGNGQSRTGGGTYGDEQAPDRLGSGGGEYGAIAGAGGGAVKVSVTDTATIDGTIKADGGYGSSNGYHVGGGGSGGSIWITSTTLQGGGTITANGGNADNDDRDGGGGGGGRIALYYESDQSSFATLTASGGVAEGANGTNGADGTVFLGGTTTDPINLRQFTSDGATALGAGENLGEQSMLVTFQVQDGDASDVLTPEAEIQPVGTSFNDVATHTGSSVTYSGTVVTTEVTLNALTDSTSYHWQVRACDSTDQCSNWVSFGNNAESEADISVVLNTAPDSPTIPDSAFYTDGQFTNELQPQFSFVLSDPNSLDTVAHRIQIDEQSDFSSPAVDYTSAVDAQGTQSFTVGQAAGSGSYSEGSEGQSLTTASYYWRVKAIDNKGGESAWTEASGDPDFQIDESRPSNATNVAIRAHAGANNEYLETDDQVWFNRNDLYFSWTAGSDSQGVKGYCLYLGTDSAGDPATQKGVLGSSPVSTTGSTCQFITDQTSIDFSNSAYRGSTWLTSSDDPYYLKVKTIDIANNTYVGLDDTNYVSFLFDNTAPENVTAVSAPGGSFSNPGDMYFNWPTGSGQGGSDSHSGVLGFQFALNDTSTWYGETLDPNTAEEYFSLGKSQPFYLPSDAQSQVQIGQNTIFFRVLDQAGNNSELRTAFINYGGQAPEFSQGDSVTVSPESSDTNSFAFSWPAASASSGQTIDTYYYMINTAPPSSLATMTSNSATYIPVEDNFLETQSFSGLRKGTNTIYVVAVDESDNYSPSNSVSATFDLNSDLPDPPKDITIADNSIKESSVWRASIVWDTPDYEGTGDLEYVVERSEDAESWTPIATTSGQAHVDTVAESKRYYWRVGAKDNSDESKASPSYTNAVSIIPRGTYTSPPDLTSEPVASSITTTKATITWTTSRTGDSKIAYGEASGNYFESEPSKSDEVTEHSLKLTNLKPGTTYYYKAKWTDEDGNTGESDEKTFTTDPPPTVKDVRVTNIGVASAIVNFTTENASKAKISYGTTTSFGGVEEIATSPLETTYSIELSNLQDGERYYYKINTFDAEDAEYEGTILDFETLPRPEVSNIEVQQVANTAQSTLLVTWESNTEISSIVTFYPSDRPEQIRDNVDIELKEGRHRMLIRGLLPDTAYTLRVRGQDRIGNEAVSDTIQVNTASDTRPPQISGLTVEGANRQAGDTTLSQLIVSWRTDEPATSQVEYGEGSGSTYSQLSQQEDALSINHVVIISGLTPSKVYHLRAISKDSAENTARSVDTVTITPKATDNAFDLVITNLQEAFGFLRNL